MDINAEIPQNAFFITEGIGINQKTYAIDDDNDQWREAKTVSETSLSRLKFIDDGTNVPANVEIIEEGSRGLKKKYAIIRNNNNQDIVRREVKTAGVISVSRLKFVDNGALVPDYAEIIEQGSGRFKKKYAIIRNENNEEIARREVKTLQAMSESSLKYKNGNTLSSSQEKSSINNNSQENIAKKKLGDEINSNHRLSLWSFLTTKSLKTGLSPIEKLQNQKDILYSPNPPFKNINGII